MIYTSDIKYNDETDKFQVLGYLDQEVLHHAKTNLGKQKYD